MQNIIFWKIQTLTIKWNYFYFADRPTIFNFLLSLLLDQKITLVSPYTIFMTVYDFDNEVISDFPKSICTLVYFYFARYLFYVKCCLYSKLALETLTKNGRLFKVYRLCTIIHDVNFL